MDEWETIFGEVQSLVRSKKSWSEAIKHASAFARNSPEIFDEPRYWEHVDRHNFRPSIKAVEAWAREGLGNLELNEGWEFLLLDLGDSPETFRLYRPGGQTIMSEQKFRGRVFRELIVGAISLENCFAPHITNGAWLLFDSDQNIDLTHHSVGELDDEILNWSDEYHGNNGCLLWLVVGSLALVNVIRESGGCDRLLKGRQKLYLLSGFEETFSYLGTVTPGGLIYE